MTRAVSLRSGILRGEELRGDDLALGRHRADDDVGALGADAAQVADRGEVDEVRRCREPQLHDGDQAMTAGKRAGVFPEIGEQGDGVADGLRAMIGECPWNHGVLPARPRHSDPLPDDVEGPSRLMFG